MLNAGFMNRDGVAAQSSKEEMPLKAHSASFTGIIWPGLPLHTHSHLSPHTRTNIGNGNRIAGVAILGGLSMGRWR